MTKEEYITTMQNLEEVHMNLIKRDREIRDECDKIYETIRKVEREYVAENCPFKVGEKYKVTLDSNWGERAGEFIGGITLACIDSSKDITNEDCFRCCVHKLTKRGTYTTREYGYFFYVDLNGELLSKGITLTKIKSRK